MDRREFLKATGAAALGAGLSAFPQGWAQAAGAPQRHILFFTKSAGFEHSAIKRSGERLGFAEQLLTDLGEKHGFEVTCSKDGSLFTPGHIAHYDAFCFYTTGDLTQPSKDGAAMTPEGKAALLDAIKKGKGFVGTHSATDTFHPTPDDRYRAFGDKVDPYIAMLGADFIHHDKQQKAKMRVMDNRFPGFADLKDSFELMEEWYSLKDFQKNLHVLLVQETEGMEGPHYKRGPYPATWARMHGKGRVFYTSMGHREDVWTNPIFQNILLGGISWAVGNVKADVTPNLDTAAPRYQDIPSPPPPKTNMSSFHSAQEGVEDRVVGSLTDRADRNQTGEMLSPGARALPASVPKEAASPPLSGAATRQKSPPDVRGSRPGS
jgi:type 1 glutamine amidotransferase